MHYDAIFLHAPSVYDFRKKPIFYGPVSDVIPSSPVFEMYPMGFMTISSHLEAAGFRTRIVNIAVQMLQDERFDAEEKIKGLHADVFFIDLHWMPHAHGAIELARIVKRYHPDSLVEFGGFTSSYFWEELMQHPEIDLVMRGDTTEEPTVRMMRALEKGGDLSEVPNLVWKDAEGRVHDNGITWSLEDLDSVRFDYGTMIKCCIRNMHIKDALPWLGWDRLPLTSVFTVRGCSVNCAECGGSHAANGRVVCRKAPAFRSPEKLAEDVAMIESYLDTPIFIVGDLRQHGNAYAQRFLSECRRLGADNNHIVIELFKGAGPDYFTDMDRTFPGGWSIEFSPDSHDEAVRKALGKGYTNQAIEETVPTAFQCGCSRFDLFYMNGLPFQDRESALSSARAAKKLWASVRQEDQLFIYNAPFAPFVDPGSRIFEDPDAWGYRLRARTLEDHRRLLDNPSWKQVLSYETRWMSRDEVAEVSYDAALELARCEHEAGRATKEQYEDRVQRTETARSLMHTIDDIMLIQDKEERERRLWETKDESVRMMNSTIANKHDLDWDAGSIWRNGPRVAMGLLRSFRRHRSAGHALRFGGGRIDGGYHRRPESHVLRRADALYRGPCGRADLVPQHVGVLPCLEDHLRGPEHALGGQPYGGVPAEAVEDARIGHRVYYHVHEGWGAPCEAGDDVHLVLGDLDGEADGIEDRADLGQLLFGQRPVGRVAHRSLQDCDAMVGHDPDHFAIWHIRFEPLHRETCDDAQDDAACPGPDAFPDEDVGHLGGLDREHEEVGLGNHVRCLAVHLNSVGLAHVVAGLLARSARHYLVRSEHVLGYETGDEGLRHLAGADEADPCRHAAAIGSLLDIRLLAEGRSVHITGASASFSYYNIQRRQRRNQLYTSNSWERPMSLVAFYMPLAIVAVIALGFAPLAWWASRFIRPQKPTQWMESTYECGSVPIGDAQVQFRFQYYTFALIFVVFDLVATFLMIWAVAYTGLSDTAKLMMITFFAILILGVCYSLKKEETVWI